MSAFAALRHRMSKPGWHVEVVDPDHAHVWPCRDGWEHDLESEDECLCGVKTIPVMRPDGSNGWIYHHTSLDNREEREANEEDQEKTVILLDLRLIAIVGVVVEVIRWLFRRRR